MVYGQFTGSGEWVGVARRAPGPGHLCIFARLSLGGGSVCKSISPSPPARPLAPRRHRRRALCCAAGQGSRMTSPGHRPWECAVLERRHGSSPAETGRRASLPRSDHTTRTRRAVKGRGAVARRLGTDVWGLNTELELQERRRGASGVAAGDITGLWQGLRCPRIAQ